MSLVEKALTKQQGQKPSKRSVPDERVLDEDAIAAESSDSSESPAFADLSDKALIAAGFRSADNGINWQLSKQFRRIKRPIAKFATNSSRLGADHGNVILVTSALPREGKTFCAMNLALSLARDPDVDILLIDADVHRPSLSKSVGLRNSVGVLEYLADPNIDFEDIVRPTRYDALTFIAAGHSQEAVHDLLASNRAEKLIREAAAKPEPTRRRIAIIDAPPLLPTTEAQVLCALVGMVVMVVDSQTTNPDLVLRAQEQIHTDKAVNYILNRAAESLLTDYQGGYYGYGYEADPTAT